MTLDQLKPGDRAVVTGWTSPEPPSRLLEMGILRSPICIFQNKEWDIR